MVKRGTLPSGCGVAVGTRQAEATLVYRWIGMTGHAGLRRAFVNLVNVALRAGNRRVLAS